MSPILKRLAGLLGRATPPVTPEQESPETPQRRRRRGGRGRGSGAGAAQAAERPANATTPTPPAAAPRAPTPDVRSRSGGGGPGSYERRRPPRRNLDQPLPEDIAFRPPAEGGDRSILPSRRRPPPGLKATRRVLVAGSRFVPHGGSADDVADAEFEDEDAQEVTEAVAPTSNDADPADGAAVKKRRRGRRGGRGRRRGGSAAEPAEGDRAQD